MDVSVAQRKTFLRGDSGETNCKPSATLSSHKKKNLSIQKGYERKPTVLFQNPEKLTVGMWTRVWSVCFEPHLEEH